MNTLAIAISIVLLPGLIASVICDKLTVHSPRWDAFKYSIYSFLFGILSYCLLQIIKVIVMLLTFVLCTTPYLPSYKLQIWSIVEQANPHVPLIEVALASLLSLVIAACASWIVNHKVLNRIARRFNLSHKYGDENLFSYFLNIQDVNWVYVLDKEKGLTYMGEVVSFSECDNIQEVLLSNVTVYEYEDSKELYSLSMVYLSKPTGGFVIEVPATQN